MKNLQDIMNLTKEQIKALSDDEKAQVKKILEAEIENIMKRNKK